MFLLLNRQFSYFYLAYTLIKYVQDTIEINKKLVDIISLLLTKLLQVVVRIVKFYL